MYCLDIYVCVVASLAGICSLSHAYLKNAFQRSSALNTNCIVICIHCSNPTVGFRYERSVLTLLEVPRSIYLASKFIWL